MKDSKLLITIMFIGQWLVLNFYVHIIFPWLPLKLAVLSHACCSLQDTIKTLRPLPRRFAQGWWRRVGFVCILTNLMPSKQRSWDTDNSSSSRVATPLQFHSPLKSPWGPAHQLLQTPTQWASSSFLNKVWTSRGPGHALMVVVTSFYFTRLCFLLPQSC